MDKDNIKKTFLNAKDFDNLLEIIKKYNIKEFDNEMVDYFNRVFEKLNDNDLNINIPRYIRKVK